jgi:HAD superfamily hydrolase (TIGR01509 family)
MLKAVLFDVDGTLAETEEFHRSAFNAVFAAQGLAHAWSAAQYRELLKVTGGKERMQAYFASQDLPMPESRIRELHLAKNAAYAQFLDSGAVPLRPGVLRLMREIREQGLGLGLATTTSEANLEALLRPVLGAAWADRFDCIVAGDQVRHKKPAPDVYLACLERLGLRPAEALAIEDSAAGLRSAQAAGIAVLATPSRYTDRDDLSAAQACVPDLGEPDRSWGRPAEAFPLGHVRAVDLPALVDRRPGAGAVATEAPAAGENFAGH